MTVKLMSIKKRHKLKLLICWQSTETSLVQLSWFSLWVIP
jgi:hypothetical protein